MQCSTVLLQCGAVLLQSGADLLLGGVVWCRVVEYDVVGSVCVCVHVCVCVRVLVCTLNTLAYI